MLLVCRMLDHSLRMNRWAIETLNEYYPLAIDPNNDLVKIIPTIQFFHSKTYTIKLDECDNPTTSSSSVSSTSSSSTVPTRNDVPGWLLDNQLQFQPMPIEMLVWQNTSYQLKIPSQTTLIEAGYSYYWLFHPPIVNVPKMTVYLVNVIMNHPIVTKLNIHLEQPYQSLDKVCIDEQSALC